MARKAFLTVVATLAALSALAASAGAAPVKLSFTSEPLTVGGYAVEKSITANIDRPHGDGFITAMSADIVDVKTGKQVPISRIMLHHIVFAAFGNGQGNRPFYGDGEERAIMKLPAGYGYPVAAADRWAIVWMLMNHRAQTDSVKIRWRLTWDTNPALKPVTPVVFDASNGAQGLTYDVAGGGRAGSYDVRTQTRAAPLSGRIVAGLGHVHGGAVRLTLTQPGCGNRVLYNSRPKWGAADHPFYTVQPIAIAGMLSVAIPLSAGLAVGEPQYGLIGALGGLNLALVVPARERTNRWQWGLIVVIGAAVALILGHFAGPSIAACTVVTFVWLALWSTLRVAGLIGMLAGFVVSVMFIIISGLPEQPVVQQLLLFLAGALLGLALMLAAGALPCASSRLFSITRCVWAWQRRQRCCSIKCSSCLSATGSR